MALLDWTGEHIEVSGYTREEKERLKAVLPVGATHRTNPQRMVFPATLFTSTELAAELLTEGEATPEYLQWHDYWADRWAERLLHLKAPVRVCAMKPWDHQTAAYNYARNVQAALLDLPMGGGKTKVTHDIVSNSKDKKTLIVSPSRVVDVWPFEFEKHRTELTPVILPLSGGSVEERTTEADKFFHSVEHGVAVINYEACWREPFISWASNQQWDRIVLDEVHRIKGGGTIVSNSLNRLGRLSNRRLGLSGTPMAEGPLDLYGIYRFLDCGIFGTNKDKFYSNYAIRNPFFLHQVLGIQNEQALMDRFRMIAYEVPESVLGMRPATDQFVYATLPSNVWRCYKDIEKDGFTRIGISSYACDNPLTRRTREQQIAAGFITNTGGADFQDLHHAKDELLKEILEDIKSPVVVFSQYKEELDRIGQVGFRAGHKVSEVSGRHNELQAWKDGKTSLLNVQIQSGSEGLDFTRARYGIYYSIPDSLRVYLQSRKRLDRPGQKRPVTFIFLLMKRTIDVSKMKALIAKRDIIEYLRTIPPGGHSETV